MKLLIKIFLDDLNPYDLDELLKIINLNISDKNNTEICIMTNESDFNYDPYKFFYLSEVSIPKMINYKLNEINWDIILPIYKPCILSKGFDLFITQIYKENFPKLDGILWLNDNEQKDIIKYTVVGKEYYNKFGLYNPAYNKKNFEEEFTEIAKITNKYFFVEKTIIKTLSLKSDDDKVFELRKKFNFGIYE